MSAIDEHADIVASAQLWADLDAPKLPPGMFYRVRDVRDGILTAHFEVSIQKWHGKRGRSHVLGVTIVFPQDFDSGREAILAACVRSVEKATYRDPLAFSEQYREALGYVGDHA